MGNNSKDASTSFRQSVVDRFTREWGSPIRRSVARGDSVGGSVPLDDLHWCLRLREPGPGTGWGEHGVTINVTVMEGDASAADPERVVVWVFDPTLPVPRNVRHCILETQAELDALVESVRERAPDAAPCEAA